MKMNRKNMNYYNERGSRGGEGGGGGGEEGRREGGREGGRYNSLDYSNYPTAPRNYPLKYTPGQPPGHLNNNNNNSTPTTYHNAQSYHNEPQYSSNRRVHNGYDSNYGSLSRHPPPYEERGGVSSLTNPRQRYHKTAEEYHHAYRGGYRPGGVDTDGYTTDGSGSVGYRDVGGSGGGFENFRYPESEALLPGTYLEGSIYPRAVLRKIKGKRRQEDIDCTRISHQSCDGGGGGGGGGRGGGEKEPFLGVVEPVRLTPSWESTNVPSEELNFKGLNTFENFEVGLDPPTDRYRLVFLTLVLHGVGTLMPWNMFITAKNYFVEYKLATADEDLNIYATNFLPYIGYASQIPNVIFNWLNIFIQMGGNLTTRIVWSILVEVVVFVLTVVLAMVDSSDWPGVFFWITIATVVVLNVANGIYQNTVYGMAARLPFSYTGAVVLGSNISGTFTALINIMAIAMAPNTRTSAIYYFITALFVLLACFDTYFALPLNRFFRYHEAMHERAMKASKTDRRKPRTPYWHIFKSAFPQLFNVFMVFFVTLAVFPAVLADTCRTEEDFPITPKYFQAVTCFLTFNVFAMLGNMLPALFTWPSPRFLCVPVLLRILLIPAFVLCNFKPIKAVRIMPVLIDSDWAFWALSVVLGLTSGYYSSLAMMYCPRTVEAEHAPVAGMMGAASLITGIFTGIVFQIVCTYAVTNISFEIPGYEFPFSNCTNR